MQKFLAGPKNNFFVLRKTFKIYLLTRKKP